MILAILQARTSSCRLPGKVLKPLLGRELILREVERVQRSQEIDQLLIATSTDPSDDGLAALCEANGLTCFRGSLEDVLERFYMAAQPYQPEHVVRLTGDCPLLDPAVLDAVIRFYKEGGYDYATNSVHPTYPDGLDVEIFRFACLERAFHEAKLPTEREHVTPWVRKQDFYKIGHYKGPQDLSHLRWTVDAKEDYELATMIYERLFPTNPNFTTEDVLALLEERPELKTWNTRHERNESFIKAEAEEQKAAATSLSSTSSSSAASS